MQPFHNNMQPMHNNMQMQPMNNNVQYEEEDSDDEYEESVTALQHRPRSPVEAVANLCSYCHLLEPAVETYKSTCHLCVSAGP